MDIRIQRKEFEENAKIYESVKVKFIGVEGYDVYNPSIPFEVDGKRYMFGRVEKRDMWADSVARLFEMTGKDEWTLVNGSMIYQLEDPYIAFINSELVMGGTHVRKVLGEIDTYFAYFYKGDKADPLSYYTTGPEHMKDIRLVELENGKLGVFSRPRSEEIRKKYGSESVIGFTVVDGIEDMDPSTIENAKVIEGLFEPDEWGGCNQCYLLDSGKIGVIGHKCYKEMQADGVEMRVYLNVSFVFDMEKHEATDLKVIGTRNSYPKGAAKKEDLEDCAFTIGIEMREDGKVDLYSGIGDVEVGRIVIDYPFKGYGNIIK